MLLEILPPWTVQFWYQCLCALSTSSPQETSRMLSTWAVIFYIPFKWFIHSKLVQFSQCYSNTMLKYDEKLSFQVLFIQTSWPWISYLCRKDVFQPPGTQRGPFKWEVYFLISGRQVLQCPPWICNFLSNIQNHAAEDILGVVCLVPRQYKGQTWEFSLCILFMSCFDPLLHSWIYSASNLSDEIQPLCFWHWLTAALCPLPGQVLLLRSWL